MITNIVRLLKHLVGIVETDVEAIISPLTNIVSKLEAHRLAKYAEVAKHATDAADSERKANLAEAEATKATNAAAKITKMVQ